MERKKKVMKVVESYVTKAGAEDEKIIDLNSLLLLINRCRAVGFSQRSEEWSTSLLAKILLKGSRVTK